MPHRAHFHPLGYPVDITSNCERVLVAARESWGSWHALFDKAPLRFRIQIHDGRAPRSVPRFDAPPELLQFSCDEDNFSVFDLKLRTGYMSLCGRVLRHQGNFRHRFLEVLVLTALDAVYFTPLHAACVAREGNGILLCGDSGAGKSCLSYACARHGWTFISDDAVHVAPGPERIGVGGSGIVHLREPARALFPELSDLESGAAPNGKQAIEIDVAARGFATAPSAIVSQCLFLRRRPGQAAVRPFSTSAAVHYFLKYLYPRETAAAERHLREFLNSPLLLEYEHIEDAVEAIESCAGALQ